MSRILRVSAVKKRTILYLTVIVPIKKRHWQNKLEQQTIRNKYVSQLFVTDNLIIDGHLA